MDNDGRFDFGDLDDAYELEPISLQEAAEIFCRAAWEMSESERAEVREALTRDLPLENIMENENPMQCANCGQPIRRMRFNSMPVWEHLPHPPGLIWPNTLCRVVDGHATPVWSQLLNQHDRAFLQQIGIKIWEDA